MFYLCMHILMHWQWLSYQIQSLLTNSQHPPVPKTNAHIKQAVLYQVTSLKAFEHIKTTAKMSTITEIKFLLWC